MTQPKECPKCGLINPDTAVRCDCGYNFSGFSEPPPKLPEEPWHKVQLTTAPNLEGYLIKRAIQIVAAECAFGMNIFRDLFAEYRDLFGGRSVATQKVLRDARNVCLSELKKEAHAVGANAVIAVDLDYSEFSGGGKSMLFLVASGTAVWVEKVTEAGGSQKS